MRSRPRARCRPRRPAGHERLARRARHAPDSEAPRTPVELFVRVRARADEHADVARARRGRRPSAEGTPGKVRGEVLLHQLAGVILAAIGLDPDLVPRGPRTVARALELSQPYSG